MYIHVHVVYNTVRPPTAYGVLIVITASIKDMCMGRAGVDDDNLKQSPLLSSKQ